jgi:predicted house-cleaning noncanonical NTP pyrophosphatase (MazG superfamily)
MKYNKLVRDKIPEYIIKKGGVPITHIASETEYWQKLKEKLREEIKEFTDSENIEEIADIQEVIDAICKYKKFNNKKLETIKNKKVKERGAFKKRIILEES